jgi:hypothetical protein
MAHISRHHFDDLSDPPRRRRRIWGFVKRYQLVELFLMIAVIVGGWVGMTLGNLYL